MAKIDHMTESGWRYSVLVQLVLLRRAIFLLLITIAILGIGLLSDLIPKEWAAGALFGGLAMAVTEYLWANSSARYLAKISDDLDA